MSPRWPWLLLGGAACTALGLARWLEPAAAGVGTHTQLGLPPCGLLTLLGVPCPGCGLTTSFAHLARLQLVPALRANPIGLPLFLATVAAVPICFVGAARRWPLVDTLDALGVERPLWWLVGGAAASWAARLIGLF